MLNWDAILSNIPFDFAIPISRTIIEDARLSSNA
jgi:hypothetical protein